MNEERWYPAGRDEEYEVGQPRLLRADGRRLAVIRAEDDSVYAIDDRCPHEGYPLTKGTVNGCELTCCYHNFKFDLRTGACARGEPVETFPVRIRDGQIEVHIAAPDLDEIRRKAFASLRDGLFERRDGQIAREVVRLLQAGVEPIRIAIEAARFDAERAPWGISHVPAVAVDALALCDRYPGPSAVRPLMQPLELAAESNARRPRIPEAPAIDPGPDRAAAERRYRAAHEAERLEEAEGLARGAWRAGWGWAGVEPWVLGAPCDDFLSFGHALIYATKLGPLIEAAGQIDDGAAGEALLVGLVREQLNATRESTLPEWGWWRKALVEVQPRFDGWWATRNQKPPAGPDDAWLAGLLGRDRRAAIAGLTAALDAGRHLDDLADTLVVAAAERIRRFDPAHDATDTVQEGWLDVTHCLTFAEAVRHALARHPHAEALALLYQGARFVQNAGALDRADAAPVPAALDATLSTLAEAITAHDGDAAEAAMRGLLTGGQPLDPLRALIEDLPLDDAFFRPIVVAHAIKTTATAFAEHARRPGDVRVLVALARFAAGPVRQRFIGTRAHEAVRFIIDGKVPRLLT